MAGGVQRGDGDVFPDVENFLVCWGCGYCGAVFAAYDGEFLLIV